MSKRKHTVQSFAAVPLVVGILLLAGCDHGRRDLENFVAEVKQRPAPPLDPLPVMQQFETFIYDAEELRDPFSSPQRDDEATGRSDGPRPDAERRKEPLETYPLDGIDMVGTLGSEGDLVALVMDPERVIHRVNVGNYLGQSDGRITAIREDRIELVELVSDGAGGWLERQATVALDNE